MSTDTNNSAPQWLATISTFAALATSLISYNALQNSIQESQAARSEAAAQQAHAEKVFESSQAAMLAFDRMTTRTNIRLTADGWDIARMADGVAAPQSPDFATVRNFGPGAALDCTAVIRVTEINGEKLAQAQTRSTKCSPMNIPPNGTSHVYALPDCIANDTAKEVRWAKGEITFTCFTTNKKKVTTTQTIQALVNYEERYVNFIYEGPSFIDNGSWF